MKNKRLIKKKSKEISDLAEVRDHKVSLWKSTLICLVKRVWNFKTLWLILVQVDLSTLAQYLVYENVHTICNHNF